MDEILPRLLEKQFFGTSHIESEESDKNLHWKPVLPQPFSKEKIADGRNVAVIATDETKYRYKYGTVKSIGSRKTEGSIAAGLYDILRDMDHIGAQDIYAESFSDDRLGGAIMNRMIKAAGHHVIHV